MTKYQLVIETIENLIQNKIIQCNDKLPSIRNMSKRLCLSTMTILEAYTRLQEKGVIESKERSGYYLLPKQVRKSLRCNLAKMDTAEKIKCSKRQVKLFEHPIFDHCLIPLGRGVAEAEFFPCDKIAKSYAKCAKYHPLELNSYMPGIGYDELRKKLCLMMTRFGASINLEDMIVTSGATQALYLATNALTNAGDTILIESPGYYGFYSLAKSLKLKVVEIPSDPHRGLSISAIMDYLQARSRPKLILLSPTLSNPTSGIMPLESRIELVKLCKRYKLAIVEDATYAELIFNSNAPKSLKSLDNENVIFIGSLSKVIAPGHRIGWISPGKYRTKVLTLLYACSTFANTPTQMAINLFLDSYNYDYLIREVRKRYKRNIELFKGEISHYFPEGTEINDPIGGHFLWIKFPKKYFGKQVAEKALQLGCSLAPGEMFSGQGNYKNFLRINCGVIWSPKIRTVFKKLFP